MDKKGSGVALYRDTAHAPVERVHHSLVYALWWLQSTLPSQPRGAATAMVGAICQSPIRALGLRVYLGQGRAYASARAGVSRSGTGRTSEWPSSYAFREQRERADSKRVCYANAGNRRSGPEQARNICWRGTRKQSRVPRLRSRHEGVSEMAFTAASRERAAINYTGLNATLQKECARPSHQVRRRIPNAYLRALISSGAPSRPCKRC